MSTTIIATKRPKRELYVAAMKALQNKVKALEAERLGLKEQLSQKEEKVRTSEGQYSEEMQ